MKRTTRSVATMILSVTLVFTLVLGGFGILGAYGDPSVAVQAVGSDSYGGSGSGSSGSGSGSSSYGGSGSSSTKKPTVKKSCLTVKGKTAKVTAGKKTTLAKSKILKIKNAGGKATYKIVKVNKSKKYFTINKKTGKLKIKKGLKAGTYKLKIRVKTTGSSKCKAGNKTVTVTIKAKKAAKKTTKKTTTPAATSTGSEETAAQ